MAWLDVKSSNGYGIVSRPVTRAGMPYGIPSVIRSHSYTSGAGRPDVGSLNGHFLVAWMSKVGGLSSILGANVMADGTVLQPGGFRISRSSGDAAEPDVNGAGDFYVVVWADPRGGDFDVYAKQVSLFGGIPTTNDRLVAGGPGDQRVPAITTNTDDGFLVVWAHSPLSALTERDATAAFDAFDIRAASLTRAVTPSLPFVVTSAQDYQFYPAIASAGRVALSAWLDFRAWNVTASDTYGAVITAAGPHVPEFLIRD